MTDHRQRGNNGHLGDERGQSELATFPLIVLVLVFFLGLTAFVVKVRPAQVTVMTAARACARQGVTTLDAGRGLSQAQSAGWEALQARHLDPERATITVAPLGAWNRWTAVQCTVTYAADVRAVPFGRLFAGRPEIPLQATYTLLVDPYQSRWEGP